MRSVLILATYAAAFAQTQTVTVRGLIRDVGGGVVEHALVVLTNVDQQRDWKVRSGPSGEYVLVQIPPGNYSLTVEATGFKTHERKGLILQVAQTAAIDCTLEIGPVTESLQVTAGTPLLETANSFVGEVVNSRSAENLPLLTRSILQIVAVAPGIADSPNFRGIVAPSGDSRALGFSANGGRGVTSEVLLDGSPQITIGFNEPTYVPQPEATQEFNIQTNSLPAEYGRSGGAVINVVHRSGTRNLHGTLYEFLLNDKLNANTFFDNRNGRPRGAFRANIFGFTLGGPLTPSRKSTFFFVNIQRVLVVLPFSATFTVPTTKMKSGDFSEVGPVYDPRSIDESGRRQPFAGNRIPAAQWNPVGANLIKYYPDPSSAGLANNYFGSAAAYPRDTDVSVKIDRRISDRQNLFARYSLSDGGNKQPNFFGNIASPNFRTGHAHYRSAAYDHTLYAAGWVLHGNYGYTSVLSALQPSGQDFDITTLGFPGSMRAAAQTAVFPTIFVAGYPPLGTTSNDVQAINIRYYSHSFTADASRVANAHTIKTGASYRAYRASIFQPTWPSGLFQFSEGFTRETFDGNRGGHSMASLLLGMPFGLPNAGGMGYEPELAIQVPYWALYAEDTWRLSSRLVLDIGLRWDSDRPLTERHDRTSWFDFNAPLPLTVPGLAPLKGGLVFAGRNGAPRGNKDADNNNFGPRVGVAYRVLPDLVVRSGFGLMFGITTGFGPNSGNTGALSFNAFTDFVSTVDGGRTPFTTLSNPFPAGFNKPADGRDGLLSFIGQDLPAVVRYDRTPYVAQWHFNVQSELHRDTLLDVGYVGSAGVKLLAQTQLDQLPDRYLASGDALSRIVANPFFGIAPITSAIGQPSITAGQLLRPYPQFNSVLHVWGSFGHSSYHALQAKLRRRYRGGLQLLASYTWSKSLDDNSGVDAEGNQNPDFVDNNRRNLDKSYSAYDIPHRFVVSPEYDLPVGLGRPFLNRKGVLNAIAGGWRAAAIISIQSGPPISVVSAPNTSGSYGGGQRPDRTGISSRTAGSVEDRLDNYLNPAAFSSPQRFTFGTASRFLPENRGPGLSTWNVTLAKSFHYAERLHLDVRAEAFNMLNHANFQIASSSTVFGQPQFGTVTQTETQRWIQLVVKLRF